MKLGLIAVLAGSALLAAAGTVTAYQELDVFSAGGLGRADRFAALAAQNYRHAPSLLGKKLVLDACVEAIAGIYGRMQPGDQRLRVLEHCRSEAGSIVAEVPSHTYAYYVGALSAAGLDDRAGFNANLLRSQMTGPNEQWVAELRANLVETHFASAAPEVLERHQADLRLLVASARGIASISDRYIDEPAFRERITAIVETMPQADQVRFVSTVRRAAAR
jgi:hypothetical protein